MGELDEFTNVACSTKRRFISHDGPLNAKDAKERAISSTKIRIESELADVYQNIYEASGGGLYEIIVHKTLSEEALKRLTELGYKYEKIVSNSSRNHDDEFEQYNYKIIWK
jgi:hypothetical protein